MWRGEDRIGPSCATTSRTTDLARGPVHGSARETEPSVWSCTLRSTVREAWRMHELDEQPPSVPDLLARAAIAASPRLAGSLAILYEGIRDRWVARGSQVLAEVAAGAPVSELERRLRGDDALDASLTAAVEAGARSSLEAKRRLLGRVVARAVLDDSRMDEAMLIVGVLSQIDAPHVRCLEAVRRAEEQAEVAGEVAPRADGAERETVQRIAVAGRAHPVPVLAALASLGLLEAQGVNDGTTIVKGLTPFGLALLTDLRDIDET